MHRIWLINPEGVLDQAPTREILVQHLCRYLHFVNPGDIFMTSVDFPEDYLSYICRLRGLSEPQKWLIKIDLHIPYFLCDCIQKNRRLMNIFKGFGRSSQYVLEPLIDSPKVVALSEATGIPYAGNSAALINEGLIKKVNEKVYFRQLAEELGIAYAPGMVARTPEELEQSVNALCKSPGDKAIFKKSFAAGGFGNMAGERAELLRAIPSICDGSTFVVEQLLDFEATIGSLSELRDDSIVFRGLDRQIIEDFGWHGCYYPFRMESVSQEIQELERRFATRIYGMGVRGLLNIDWGLERQADGGLKVYAIEINLRHNGFHYILQLADENFDIPAEALNILYYGNFKVAGRFTEFSQLLARADEVRLDGSPLLVREKGLKEGFLFTTPLKDGVVGLLIAGDSKEAVEVIEGQIQSALGREAVNVR